MNRTRELAWRAGLVLLAILVIELAVSHLFFYRNGGHFPLALFAAALAPTVAGVWLLVPRWHRTLGVWRRLGLCLLIAFCAFQGTLFFFSVGAGIAGSIDPLPFLVFLLVFGNVFFFPFWLFFGLLAFGLMRLLFGVPEASPA